MKRLLQLGSLLALVTVLVLLVQRGTAGSGEQPSTVATGLAPAWELPQVSGGNLKSSDLAGKIVVIDFWATWCPPCRAEIPSYVELQEAYRDDDVVFVGISLDQGADANAKVRKFMTDFGINYPVVMGTAEVAEAFGGVESIPTTFVVDREGRMVNRKVGYKPKSYFEDVLSKLL